MTNPVAGLDYTANPDPEWLALREFPPAVQVPGEPDNTSLAARLRERTLPMAVDDADAGYAHAQLCEAMMRGGIELSQIFDPPDPYAPGQPLLDPELCPPWALPWLAQLAGVQITSDMSEDQQRAAIVELRAHQRGTVRMIRGAAQRYLTGTKEVVFRERDGDPYMLEIVTRPEETPDPAAVRAAIIAELPAGLMLDFHTVPGWDYQELSATETGAYSTLTAKYADYYALANKTTI